jgi:hypothetical protein
MLVNIFYFRKFLSIKLPYFLKFPEINRELKKSKEQTHLLLNYKFLEISKEITVSNARYF